MLVSLSDLWSDLSQVERSVASFSKFVPPSDLYLFTLSSFDLTRSKKCYALASVQNCGNAYTQHCHQQTASFAPSSATLVPSSLLRSTDRLNVFECATSSDAPPLPCTMPGAVEVTRKLLECGELSQRLSQWSAPPEQANTFMRYVDNCGETDDLLRCSRCHAAYFCSAKCQKVIDRQTIRSHYVTQQVCKVCVS